MPKAVALQVRRGYAIILPVGVAPVRGLKLLRRARPLDGCQRIESRKHLVPDSIRILALADLRKIMQSPVHTLCNLFAQPGLSRHGTGIARCIKNHGPLPGTTLLPEAPFWTLSQATFLRDETPGDTDRAAVIDALNVDLHGSH